MNLRNNGSHISGVRHGTPLYIAPEILKSGKASRSADVYSVGGGRWFQGKVTARPAAVLTLPD